MAVGGPGCGVGVASEASSPLKFKDPEQHSSVEEIP